MHTSPEQPGERAPQYHPTLPVGGRDSLAARLRSAWELEFSHLRWRLLFCALLARFVPEGRANRFRATIIRAIGAEVGPGTRFLGMPKLQSRPRGRLRTKMVIGADCMIGRGTILECGEKLTIGDRVALGDGVVILTTTHQLGPMEGRAGPVTRFPVVIGPDVKIGENSIVLPGVRIGDSARVLPNSVVNASVAPGATVGGIPARPVRAQQS